MTTFSVAFCSLYNSVKEEIRTAMSIKVAYTSGPIFEKIIKRYPIFSLQINYYQIDQKHK